MNKLIKEVEFGKYNFKVAINREIALKVAEEFPDFISHMMEMSTKMPDLDVAIKNGNLKELLEQTEYILENSKKVVRFALPYMLKEAEEQDVNTDDLFAYAEENDADEIFVQNLWEFVLLGFTNSGVAKTPKVTFKMK